jgi:UDP-N-acetylmuramoylalanine-D-glutamate ligase
VLFSPAYKSFDMFKDYEDRGRRFKAAVHGMFAAPGERGER